MQNTNLVGFKIRLERLDLHSTVWEAIRMHDLNYFSCFFLSMSWLHTACQSPEDAASPPGSDPASWGSPHALPLVQQRGDGGLCWGHLSWPALAQQLALAMPWYLSFLDLVFKKSLQGDKLRSVATQLSSHQWSPATGLQRARISPWV